MGAVARWLPVRCTRRDVRGEMCVRTETESVGRGKMCAEMCAAGQAGWTRLDGRGEMEDEQAERRAWRDGRGETGAERRTLQRDGHRSEMGVT